MMTADCARKITEKAKFEQDLMQFTTEQPIIEKRIIEAAEDGNESLRVETAITNLTKKYLEALGYSIIVTTSYTVIKW